jgi:hypothetical protein
MVVATCSPQARNMLATSSQHACHKLVASLATCTLCWGKVFATWKSVRNMMFGCWSQHSRHKLVTCSQHTRNITCNIYTISGEEGGGRNMENVFAACENVFATWKKCSQHGKRCSQHGKRWLQHSQHAWQHHDPTTDMFPDSNRVAWKVSDASTQIGRPGASSSVS